MSTRFERRNRGTLILLAAAVACGGWGVMPAVGGEEFRLLDDPVHLDELAAALQTTSNALCWEMHKFHRDKPDFSEAYRPAKEIWTMTGALRDALRAGPVDDRDVMSEIGKMNDLYAAVEKTCAHWGDGVRPSTPNGPTEERAVVVPGSGVDVDIPLLFGGGIRVGRSPRMVVTEPVLPALPRRSFHPNARGSKRSLEREVASVRTALNNLLEDTGAVPRESNNSPAPPKPMPPDANAGPALAPPTKIVPSANKR